GGVVGEKGKSAHLPLDAVVPERDQINDFSVLEPEPLKIAWVDEHNLAHAFDSAIAIIQPIQRGVVLIVRTQRLQDKVRRLAVAAGLCRHQVQGQRVVLELSTTARSIPGSACGCVAQVETAGLLE